jgi:integrase
VKGPHPTPKGLRHGFGIEAVTSGVPLNMVQKWLGHAQLAMTAMYADAGCGSLREIKINAKKVFERAALQRRWRMVPIA